MIKKKITREGIKLSKKSRVLINSKLSKKSRVLINSPLVKKKSQFDFGERLRVIKLVKTKNA